MARAVARGTTARRVGGNPARIRRGSEEDSAEVPEAASLAGRLRAGALALIAPETGSRGPWGEPKSCGRTDKYPVGEPLGPPPLFPPEASPAIDRKPRRDERKRA